MRKILTPVLFFAFLHYAQAQSDRDVPRTARDQVIADDLIVDGSACVGFDCVNGEVFGFKTLVLKENNVRLKFFDTSNSASFPNRSWCLEANQSANGGSNHFAILDDGAGNANLQRPVFKIEAGAPANSLYVDNGGRLGIKTANPVVEIHVSDGDSPTLRLEQNSTSGFTAQTWDVAGNETNFFIRDVTNGSTLPFRIRPGAPTSSIDIAGTSGNITMAGSELEMGKGAGAGAAKLFVGKGRTSVGNSQIDLFRGTSTAGPDFHMRMSAEGNSSNFSHNDVGPFRIKTVPTGSPIGFFTENVERMVIEANGTVRINGNATVNGGTMVTSDRRLKNSIRPLERGLKEIMLMNPIMYSYNGESNTPTDREFAGLVAQELQEIAPEFVSNQKMQEFNENGDMSVKDVLRIHDTELKYIMVNAIKEQQTLIEEQKEQILKQDERITDLEADLIELKNLVQNLQNNIEVTLNGKELGYLGQNTPNPYNGETNITYVIPSSASKSSINIHSIEGKLIKTIDLNHKGKGQIKVNAENLPAGTYSYQLIVDGKLVETKKMVLQR